PEAFGTGLLATYESPGGSSGRSWLGAAGVGNPATAGAGNTAPGAGGASGLGPGTGARPALGIGCNSGSGGLGCDSGSGLGAVRVKCSRASRIRSSFFSRAAVRSL